MLAQTLPFDPTDPAPTLSALPEKPGIFALFGADPKAEPYLARTTNIRRRLKRFLDAKPTQTKRLRLTERVARIEYTATGSDFESSLALYTATHQAFGERARKRLHLYAPYFLRMTVKNRYPRVYVTNTITKSAAENLYGPFPSRAAAERFCDEALNLFLLRRCYPDLDPDPAFPGCVYSEMKMCLAPCFKGCTDERYAEESAKVEAFLATRGQSLLDELAKERDAASEELDFEKAASIHAKIQKVEAVAALASEAVHPLAQLRAVIVQPSSGARPRGALSTQRRTSYRRQLSTTLLACACTTNSRVRRRFTRIPMRWRPCRCRISRRRQHRRQPRSLPSQAQTPADTPRDVLEQRLNEAMANLNQQKPRANNQTLADHLSLFNRWYFRPGGQENRRSYLLRSGKATAFKADSSRHLASFSRKSNGRSSDI